MQTIHHYWESFIMICGYTFFISAVFTSMLFYFSDRSTKREAKKSEQLLKELSEEYKRKETFAEKVFQQAIHPPYVNAN